MKNHWVFIFLLAAPAVLSAADSEKPLTWDECVAIAKSNNPDLFSAGQAWEAARANYKGSFNGFLPSLTLSSSISDSDNPSARNTRYNASGQASIDIINANNNAAIGSAAAEMNAAKARFSIQSAAVRFQLKQAFANYLFGQAELEVSRKIQKIRKQNAEMVTLKYDSGRESKGNMLQSKAELTEAEADLRDAERSLRTAAKALAQQLGDTKLNVQTATGSLTTNALPADPDYVSLVRINPKVAEQEATQAAALSNLKGARSSIWPTLSANYVRSAIGHDYFPDNYHWSTSGVLTIPLFGSGLTATYFNIKAAGRNLDKAKADLLSIQNSVESALEFAWTDLAAKIDQVGVQKVFLEASRQRNDEAQVRYSSGLMAFENWEIIVSDLVNFERSNLRAQRDAFISEAAWEQTTGKTLEEQ